MRGPQKPSDLLGEILAQARKVASRSDVTAALNKVLGAEVGGHCRIVGVSAGRITIEVDSAPLWAELQSFRREQIRRALNELIGTNKIADLVFRMGATTE